MLFQQSLQDHENPNDRMFSCFAYQSKDEPIFPRHCHIHVEMIFVASGVMRLIVDGQCLRLKAGDLAFVPFMAPHSIEGDSGSGCSHVILQISPSYFRSGSDESNMVKRIKSGHKFEDSYYCTLSSKTRAFSLWQKLLIYCDFCNEESYAVKARSLADAASYSALCKINGTIFLLIAELLNDGIITLSNQLVNVHEINRIEPVLQKMIGHPEERFSLEQAAKIANMSYHNFSRTFIRVVGHSFVDHQNMLRIRYAEELLRNSNDSITRIADLANFGSISYFNRVFKKHNIISPSAYRKQCMVK